VQDPYFYGDVRWTGGWALIILLGLLLALQAGAAGSGDAAESRAKLIGAWQLDAAAGQPDATWAIEQNGDRIRITQSRGGTKIGEFECNTMGKECKVKDSGHQATISMWYNGPKLVELEIHGSDVVKRRFVVTGEGNTMQMELISIAPTRKAETFQLKRVETAATRQ
jgi:hypothetical protein